MSLWDLTMPRGWKVLLECSGMEEPEIIEAKEAASEPGEMGRGRRRRSRGAGVQE
jgi:hypothetical protein